MTYRARVLVLTLAIAVLTATWLAGVLGGRRRATPPGAGISLVAPEALPAVTLVEIDGPHPVRLERGDGTIPGIGGNNGSAPTAPAMERWWVVRDGHHLPARGSRVEEFLRTLSEERTEARVAVSASGWPQFGVDDATELRLFDSAGRDVAVLFFGNRSDTGRGGYLRFDTADDVYRVGSASFFALERSDVFWSDLRLLPPGLAEDRVSALRIAADIGNLNELPRRFTYSLVRGAGGAWELDGPTGRSPVSPSRARDLVTAVLTLEGSRFAPELVTASEGGDTPGIPALPALQPVAAGHAVISVELFDGRRYTLVIDATRSVLRVRTAGPTDHRVVDRDGRTIVFEFASWNAERVLRPPEDLAP